MKVSAFTAGAPAQSTDILGAVRGSGNVRLTVADILAVAGSAFSKVNATAAPTVNDDSANTSGNGTFAIGSIWIDVTNDEAYRLVDATPTAAVWVKTTLDAVEAAGLFVSKTGAAMSGALTFTGTNHAGARLINLTTAQRLALTPGTGDRVYDTDLEKYMAYGPSGWFEIDGGVFNVKAFGATGDGVTDDTAAIQAAMDAAATANAMLLLTTGTYLTTAVLNVPSGLVIVGATGRPEDVTVILNYSSTNQDVFDIAGKTQILFSGFTIDGGFDVTHTAGNPIDINGASSRIVIENMVFKNGPDQSVYIRGTSSNITVRDSRFELNNSVQSQILCYGDVDHIFIENNHFVDSGGFCIHIDGTEADGFPTDFFIRGNRCDDSNLELIGIVYGCLRGEVTGNHAKNTGDNGISVSGKYMAVEENICEGCAHSGIAVLGSSNTVTGNVCFNNNQIGSTFGGISVGGNSGGSGSRNVVANNMSFDDQASPTQAYGIKINPGSYTLWDTCSGPQS